jgi:precorrin-8X/cobalt-precorrin-8 methylmutase
MFDHFVMVDWSAASVPRTGPDSIWVCWRGPGGAKWLENPRTRHRARALLAEWLAAAHTRGERVLVGFDFPFGYPAGFAAKLGLSGPPWRAVWDEIARLIKDDKHNGNNRFDVAEAFNRRISSASFPFWGRPAKSQRAHLAATRPSYNTEGLAERRCIDGREYMPGAQPCWKLCYPGSVGSQTLTGIPVVRALRDDPRWRDAARIWPFETGLRPPENPSVVFAEVYPSLWKKQIPPSKPKDAAQVGFVAHFFAERDRSDDLVRFFAGDPGLSAADRRLVEHEEAWALGVTSRISK